MKTWMKHRWRRVFDNQVGAAAGEYALMAALIGSIPYAVQHIKETMKNRWPRLVDNQVGASAVEYALLVSLIAVAIIASVTLLGNKIKGVFTLIAGKF